MFECLDHTCISPVERCDGEIQCKDGLDEYRCGKIMLSIVTATTPREDYVQDDCAL